MDILKKRYITKNLTAEQSKYVGIYYVLNKQKKNIGAIYLDTELLTIHSYTEIHKDLLNEIYWLFQEIGEHYEKYNKEKLNQTNTEET